MARRPAALPQQNVINLAWQAPDESTLIQGKPAGYWRALDYFNNSTNMAQRTSALVEMRKWEDQARISATRGPVLPTRPAIEAMFMQGNKPIQPPQVGPAGNMAQGSTPQAGSARQDIGHPFEGSMNKLFEFLSGAQGGGPAAGASFGVPTPYDSTPKHPINAAAMFGVPAVPSISDVPEVRPVGVNPQPQTYGPGYAMFGEVLKALNPLITFPGDVSTQETPLYPRQPWIPEKNTPTWQKFDPGLFSDPAAQQPPVPSFVPKLPTNISNAPGTAGMEPFYAPQAPPAQPANISNVYTDIAPSAPVSTQPWLPEKATPATGAAPPATPPQGVLPPGATAPAPPAPSVFNPNNPLPPEDPNGLFASFMRLPRGIGNAGLNAAKFLWANPGPAIPPEATAQSNPMDMSIQAGLIPTTPAAGTTPPAAPEGPKKYTFGPNIAAAFGDGGNGGNASITFGPNGVVSAPVTTAFSNPPAIPNPQIATAPPCAPAAQVPASPPPAQGTPPAAPPVQAPQPPAQVAAPAVRPRSGGFQPPPKELADAQAAAEQKYGLPAGFLGRITWVESGHKPVMNSQGSGAAGYYQVMPGTQKEMGLKNPNDPIESTEKSAARFANLSKQMENALGRAPTEFELYMAWQQGLGGATQHLLNPNGNATKAAAGIPAAISMNGGNPNMTSGQFVDYWRQRWARETGAGGQGAMAPTGPYDPSQGPPRVPQAPVPASVDTSEYRQNWQAGMPRGLPQTNPIIAGIMGGGARVGQLPKGAGLGDIALAFGSGALAGQEHATDRELARDDAVKRFHTQIAQALLTDAQIQAQNRNNPQNAQYQTQQQQFQQNSQLFQGSQPHVNIQDGTAIVTTPNLANRTVNIQTQKTGAGGTTQEKRQLDLMDNQIQNAPDGDQKLALQYQRALYVNRNNPANAEAEFRNSAVVEAIKKGQLDVLFNGKSGLKGLDPKTLQTIRAEVDKTLTPAERAQTAKAGDILNERLAARLRPVFANIGHDGWIDILAAQGNLGAQYLKQFGGGKK